MCRSRSRSQAHRPGVDPECREHSPDRRSFRNLAAIGAAQQRLGGAFAEAVGGLLGSPLALLLSGAFAPAAAHNINLSYDPSVPPTYRIATSGPASQGYDLLSVAVHEIGHALGFTSTFANFAAQLIPRVSYVDYAFASSPLLGNPGADYFAPIAFPNGAALMPIVEEDSEEGGSVGGLPSHRTDIPPGDGTGGLFLMDAMNPTLNNGERIHIADVDLDILADAYGYTVVPEPWPWLQSLAALAGLVRISRRRRSSFRARAARFGAALVCVGALTACGGGGDAKAECRPLIERRCKGSAMRRQCLSTHSAACNMVGPTAFREKLESWEESQSRR